MAIGSMLFLLLACGPVKHTVVFYNVENLFDTIDDPGKNDSEFTPQHEKNWNSTRYIKKLEDLSRVLSSIDTVSLPVLVGLAEIENNLVLNDLIRTPLLEKANYRFVWEEGPDERGIDCALLYRPDYFRIDTIAFLPVTIDSFPDFNTRDILYTAGWLENDYLHIFVCHWPSRRSGEETSEGERIGTANVLRLAVDRLIAADPEARVLIMGDMNDEPANRSLRESLGALPNQTLPQSKTALVNLMYDEFELGKGSYSFRGDWNMIDNLVVSVSLITNEKGFRTRLDDGHIFHQPFMEYKNDRGELSPNRTYGRSYYGGISDHFPVYLQLTKGRE